MLAASAPVFADAAQVPTESSPEASSPASSSTDSFTHAWIPGQLPYRPWSVQAGGGYNLVTGSTENYMHGRAGATLLHPRSIYDARFSTREIEDLQRARKPAAT